MDGAYICCRCMACTALQGEDYNTLKTQGLEVLCLAKGYFMLALHDRGTKPCHPGSQQVIESPLRVSPFTPLIFALYRFGLLCICSPLIFIRIQCLCFAHICRIKAMLKLLCEQLSKTRERKKFTLLVASQSRPLQTIDYFCRERGCIWIPSENATRLMSSITSSCIYWHTCMKSTVTSRPTSPLRSLCPIKQDCNGL